MWEWREILALERWLKEWKARAEGACSLDGEKVLSEWVLGSTRVALDRSTVWAGAKRQSPGRGAAVALEEARGIVAALVSKAAVDTDTTAGHSAARGVAGGSEVEGSRRRGAVAGDTGRHIRSAFCRSDIQVWRGGCCACQAS